MSRSLLPRVATVWAFVAPGFAPVPRLQIVTVADAMKLRDRAVRLPARRDDGFKRAAREVDTGAQGALDL